MDRWEIKWLHCTILHIYQYYATKSLEQDICKAAFPKRIAISAVCRAYFKHTHTHALSPQEVQNHVQKVLLSSVFDETWISTFLDLGCPELLKVSAASKRACSWNVLKGFAPKAA